MSGIKIMAQKPHFRKIAENALSLPLAAFRIAITRR